MHSQKSIDPKYSKQKILGTAAALFTGALALLSQACSNVENSPIPDSNPSAPGTVAPVIPGYGTVKEQVFAPYCIRCHGPGSSANLDTYADAVANADRIRQVMLVDKSMPPSGPLPDQYQRIVQAWLDGGTPENDIASTPTPVPSPDVTILPEPR